VRRRTAFAAAGVVGLGINAATGGLISADRQRPDVIARIGSTQHLPHAPLEVTVAPPTFARPRCVSDAGRYQLVWHANFRVQVRALADGRRLVQVANFNVVGDSRVPYLRPYPTRVAQGLPDVVLSGAGEETSGLVQFAINSPNGVLLYNDQAGGGVVAWRYAVIGRKALPLPGAACSPPANGSGPPRF
jgi:hypothetical protein